MAAGYQKFRIAESCDLSQEESRKLSCPYIPGIVPPPSLAVGPFWPPAKVRLMEFVRPLLVEKPAHRLIRQANDTIASHGGQASHFAKSGGRRACTPDSIARAARGAGPVRAGDLDRVRGFARCRPRSAEDFGGTRHGRYCAGTAGGAPS